jgi:hypothetical protein
MQDLETLTDLCKNIAGRTVCAFGDAEVSPIMSTLKHWRHEYVAMIHEADCSGQFDPPGTGRDETLTSRMTHNSTQECSMLDSQCSIEHSPLKIEQ